MECGTKSVSPLLGARHRNVCGHPRPARAASRCTPRVAGSHFPRRCLCGVHERPRRRPGYSCRVQGSVLRWQRLEQSREVPLQGSSLHLALLTRGPPARAPRPPPSLGVSETHLRGPFSFRYAVWTFASASLMSTIPTDQPSDLRQSPSKETFLKTTTRADAGPGDAAAASDDDNPQSCQSPTSRKRQ